jgi:hypothetical protein
MNGAMEVVVFFQAGRGNASACVWLRIFFALSLSSWPPPFARHAVAAPSGAVVAYFLYGVFFASVSRMVFPRIYNIFVYFWKRCMAPKFQQ